MFGPGSGSSTDWAQYPATAPVQLGSNSITTTNTINTGSITATGLATLKSDVIVGDNASVAAENSLFVKCKGSTGVATVNLSDGVNNATLKYSAPFNKTTLTANRIALTTGAVGSSIELGGTTGAILLEGASGTELSLRRTGNTRLTLDSGGIVRIGASGLATTPSLQFVGTSNGEASLQYDETNDRINVVSGEFNAVGALTANTNLSITHDATNGGKIMTKTLTNLGIGTNGTATAVQISASGNVGIGKSPSVALDVNGQMSCTSATLSQGLTAAGDILVARGGFNTLIPNATIHALTNGTSAFNNALRLSTPNLGNSFETVYKIGFGCDAFGSNDTIAAIGFNRVNAAANNNGAICFYTYNGASSGSDLTSERMRVSHDGALGIQTTTPNSGYCLGMSIGGEGKKNGAINITTAAGTGFDIAQYGTWDAGGWSGYNTIVYLSRDSSTLRSLNAYGTLNASGTDYAEYMEKDIVEVSIPKGAIVGIKANGKLTTKWSEAKSYMVKSTNPSYVGGDSWGDVGPRPQRDECSSPEEYDVAVAAYEAKLEAARVKVDRIAYSGQVPVNVLGANAGDYIVAVAGNDDTIVGTAVTEPTFEQYKRAVGRVIKVLEDGRAHINVIVH